MTLNDVCFDERWPLPRHTTPLFAILRHRCTRVALTDAPRSSKWEPCGGVRRPAEKGAVVHSCSLVAPVAVRAPKRVKRIFRWSFFRFFNSDFSFCGAFRRCCLRTRSVRSCTRSTCRLRCCRRRSTWGKFADASACMRGKRNVIIIECIFESHSPHSLVV